MKFDDETHFCLSRMAFEFKIGAKLNKYNSGVTLSELSLHEASRCNVTTSIIWLGHNFKQRLLYYTRVM